MMTLDVCGDVLHGLVEAPPVFCRRPDGHAGGHTDGEAWWTPREHVGARLVVFVNTGPKMSRGKYAAQAVHAALSLLGAHHGGPVIVLGGNPAQVKGCEVVIHDAGRTEVEPGTLTAGARWDEEAS